MTKLDIGSMKINLASATGISSEMLHIYVGLAIFAMAVLLLHNKNRLSFALLIVLTVELFNEVIDLQSSNVNGYPWDWLDTLRDVILTVIVPALCLLLTSCWKRWQNKHRPT